MVLVEKNLPANAGATGDSGLIPESGRFPGGGHSPLENLMDRGAWQAIVHTVAWNRTRLNQLSMYALWF